MHWLSLTQLPHYTSNITGISQTVMNTFSYKFKKFNLSHRQTYSYCAGPISSKYLPICYNNNVHNEIVALEQRVRNLKQPINSNFVAMFIRWFKLNIKSILPKTFRTGVKGWSFDKYILHSNAQPSVKAKLKRVKQQLDSLHIDQTTTLPKDDIVRYCQRKSFVKVENLCLRSKSGITDKAPRLIQGAQAEFICLVGPWISDLQEKIKRDWNSNNFICFTSGVPAHKAANLLMSLPGQLFEDDVSAWDAHMREPYLKAEAWLCKQLHAPKAVIDLLNQNVKTYGTTTNGLKYKCDPMRKSGDPYTSLFNSLWNACIHLYIYCQHYGYTVAQSRNNLRMLVQGDDNVMNYVVGHSHPAWRISMANFGFKADAILRQPMDVEFCSTRLYPVKSGFTFVPKIGKVLSKLNVFINPKIFLFPDDLVYNTCLSLVDAVSPIYCFSKILESIQNKIRSRKKLYNIVEEWKMVYSFQEPTVETKSWFFHHYGLNNYLEQCLINLYKNSTLRSFVECPTLWLVLDRDTDGPKCLW
jgi:hypothetical protein